MTDAMSPPGAPTRDHASSPLQGSTDWAGNGILARENLLREGKLEPRVAQGSLSINKLGKLLLAYNEYHCHVYSDKSTIIISIPICGLHDPA